MRSICNHGIHYNSANANPNTTLFLVHIAKSVWYAVFKCTPVLSLLISKKLMASVLSLLISKKTYGMIPVPSNYIKTYGISSVSYDFIKTHGISSVPDGFIKLMTSVLSLLISKNLWHQSCPFSFKKKLMASVLSLSIS